MQSIFLILLCSYFYVETSQEPHTRIPLKEVLETEMSYENMNCHISTFFPLRSSPRTR